jgi:DNA-binding transcriptional regulator YiaG
MSILKHDKIIKGSDAQSKLELAQSLKRYRLQHAMSQEALAKLIGTSVFSVNRWERSKHYPPQTTIRLMKLLGVL